MRDSQLIFIISQPRSGSTLLQSILSNHPEVETTAEPWLLLPYLSIFKENILKGSYDHQAFHIAFYDFQQSIGLDSSELNSIQRDFLISFYKKGLEKNKKKYFLDKTPRYYEIANEISAIFPEAKIIILTRSLIPVLRSVIKFGKVKNIYDLLWWSRDLIEAPKMIHSFLMDHQNDKNTYHITYENLINNPEIEVTKLCQFLEMDFIDELLNLKTQKISGRMGDTNIHQTNKIAKSSTKNSDKKWARFEQDYKHYIENILASDNHDELQKSSAKFKRFLKYHRLMSMPQIKASQLMDYFIFRLRLILSKFKTSIWY